MPGKFEEIFRKHARSHPNSLTADELMEMLKANREPKDFGGWLVSRFNFENPKVISKLFQSFKT